MKNLITLSILFVLCLVQKLSAQVTPTTSGTNRIFNYELLIEAPIYTCDILGNQTDSTLQIAPKGAVFTKIDTRGNQVVIRFWLWKKDTHKQYNLNYTDSTKTQQKFFLLSVDEFNQKAIPRYSKSASFTIGATHIPFRIRSNPFDFSNHISIGTSFGAKFPLSNYKDISLNVIGGINIANITLDSLSTNGMIEDVPDTEPAFTPSLGVVFEFSKAQIGLYLGWDLLSGKEKDIWIYQGKPWISIGVGTSIFTSPTNSAIPNNNQNQ